MNRVSHCNGCEFMKIYNYEKKIFYCNHKDRIDDMGKIGTDRLPETSPEWCPLKNK